MRCWISWTSAQSFKFSPGVRLPATNARMPAPIATSCASKWPELNVNSGSSSPSAVVSAWTTEISPTTARFLLDMVEDLRDHTLNAHPNCLAADVEYLSDNREGT